MDEEKYQQYCNDVDTFYTQLGSDDELSDEEIELIEQASRDRLSRYGYSEQAK